MNKRKIRGKCPWCEEYVHAKIFEGNRYRRDACICPECGDKILVCRMPGCRDYAAGGETWDDEFCPPCSKVAAKVALVAITTVLIPSLGIYIPKRIV